MFRQQNLALDSAVIVGRRPGLARLCIFTTVSIQIHDTTGVLNLACTTRVLRVMGDAEMLACAAVTIMNADPWLGEGMAATVA
jgi:hypothetical protein